MLAAAVALVFLLLLYLYERFTIALAILLMPLLSLAAVFIGLRLTHVELNISSMMGMTMIVGIVTEVAIFYFSEYETVRRAGGNEADALVAAGLNRMRPIAMTTFAAILALLPLAFAWGEGAAMQQPLAVATLPSGDSGPGGDAPHATRRSDSNRRPEATTVEPTRSIEGRTQRPMEHPHRRPMENLLQVRPW